MGGAYEYRTLMLSAYHQDVIIGRHVSFGHSYVLLAGYLRVLRTLSRSISRFLSKPVFGRFCLPLSRITSRIGFGRVLRLKRGDKDFVDLDTEGAEADYRLKWVEF